MKRQFVAGVMGLAVAGCAHFRSEAPKGPPSANPASPVGMQPVPSIYDTINRGTGNPAMAQSALGNPNDPRWSGQAPAPDPNRPGEAPAPVPSQAPQSTQMAAANPAAAAAPPQWSGPVAQPSPTTQPGLGDQPGPAPQPGLAAQPVPTTQPGLGNPPGPAAQPGGRVDETVNMPAGDLAAAAAAASLPAGASPMAGDPGAGLGQSPGAATASPASMAPGMASVPTATDTGGAASISTIPSTLERPGGPIPEMLARPGGLPGSATGSLPAGPADSGGPAGALPGGPPDAAPNGATAAGPAINGLPPVGEPPASIAGTATAPTDPAVNPSGGQTGQAPAVGATRPQPVGDPLLGPDPDLMPALPPLPDAQPAASSTTAKPSAPAGPAGTTPATGAAPATDLPSTGPAAGAADAPPPLMPAGAADAPPAGPAASPPPELGPPSADNRAGGSGSSAGAVQVVDLPPLDPVPSGGQVSGATVQRTVASAGSAVPVRRATARRDVQVQRTSLRTPAGEGEPDAPATRHQATRTAAKIGDEIITQRDLNATVNEYCKRSRTPFDRLSRDERNALGGSVLKKMIDEKLLLQEARRMIKNPKMYTQFTEQADEYWREEILPRLEGELHVDTEHQLRERLKENGRSFDFISQSARQNWMAEAFLHEKLKSRIKVELPELLKYYNEHKSEREYDRPAEISWREILVDVKRYPSREEARRKADSLHQALRNGTDFAKLASAQSEGPSRSREQGGLMQTTPGSYGVTSVNEALAALPMGQVSAVLEGPSSFHIVRLEGRHAAGPAPFEALQDQIRSAIVERKYETARAEYLARLWKESHVWTAYDDTESDPRLSFK